MPRYIDADELIIEICKHKGCFATGEGNEPFMAWEVEDYINDAPTEDVVPTEKWISADERLPEYGKEVLICIEQGTWCGMETASLEEGGAFIASGFSVPSTDVAYWMPIPELPKGGKDAEIY